jgi:hypothetical protein
VHEAIDGSLVTIFEDFRDDTVPPTAPPTIAMTTTAAINTITNNFLDIPQYLRGGVGGRSPSCSSSGAAELAW